MPRSERRQEINVRPESGGYPKGEAVVLDTDRDADFHHALGQGVDKSSRQFDRESDFHQALGQGVDKSIRELDHDSKHVSDHKSV